MHARPPHPAAPLLDHCPETLPREAYTDHGWFARERRAIWARNWILAGRLADLPRAHVRRLEVAGEPLILLRDADGSLRCFHNTCRHRGAELCAADGPLGLLITCPYHQWAYDRAGRLVSTAFATPTDDFRRDEHGLYPVPVRLWNGFVFVCLAETPPALAPDLGLSALDNWPMEGLQTGHVLETEIACNWKVFWENYNECLHCPGIHPELCKRVPIYRRGVMSPSEAPGWRPGQPEPPALSAGAQSWTPDGAPCGPVFPGLSAAQRAAGHTFVTLYPTMFVVAHVDHLRAVSLTPLGPEATRLRAEWLFPAETLAQPGFDAAAVARFAATVLAEDAAACEMNQRGLRTSRHRAGRLMPQEFELHRFHRWVLEQLAGATA